MQVKKKEAGGLTPTPINTLRTRVYQKSTLNSREIFKDQLGLMLWYLQGPVREQQRRAGYQLLEVLLQARYEEGVQ